MHLPPALAHRWRIRIALFVVTLLTGALVFGTALAQRPTPQPADRCEPWKQRVRTLQRQLNQARAQGRRLQRQNARLRNRLSDCRENLATCRQDGRRCGRALDRCAGQLRACMPDLRHCEDSFQQCEEELLRCRDSLCPSEPVLCKRLFPPCPAGTVKVGTGPCSVECVDPATCQPICDEGTHLDPDIGACCPDHVAMMMCMCAPGYFHESIEVRDDNGCLVRVDCTCEPGPCSDGDPLLCDAIPPECPDGTSLAIQNGCWACVDPDTCEPTCEEGHRYDPEVGACCPPVMVADCPPSLPGSVCTTTEEHDDNGCLTALLCHCEPPENPCDGVDLPICDFPPCTADNTPQPGERCDTPGMTICGNEIGDAYFCLDDGSIGRVIHPPLSPFECNLVCVRPEEPPPPSNPFICGGIAGFMCPRGLTCFDGPGDGCSPACGGADCGGICGRPTMTRCGGIAGIPCPEGLECIDDPRDDCDPDCGGADCGGVCVDIPSNFCGGIAGIPCPDGFTCIDDPDDTCDPDLGGADCGGICVPGGPR